MLQQTQAPRVAAFYAGFLERFPTVASLAAASRAEVVRAWGSLGYQRRAVALHEAARVIEERHGGRVPRTPDELLTLPGVGPYTAGAVASIAFGARVPAIDTNVRRIVARVALGAEPDEVALGVVAAEAGEWLHERRPGDWNQALMDLGREVCRPVPRCGQCPIAEGCRFRASGRIGRRSSRQQPPFEGSLRQVRGRIVAALRERDAESIAELARQTGFEPARIEEALAGLTRDGVVGRSGRRRFRLAEG